MTEVKKADLGKRIIAAIIDSVIASILGAIIPFLGGLIGAAYALTKDALLFQLLKKDEWKNVSVGKKLMGLQVQTATGATVDLVTSIKRNVPFAIAPILMIIPVLGWIAALIIGPIISLIECILVFTDPAGRRMGDRFACTTVVDAPAKAPAA